MQMSANDLRSLDPLMWLHLTQHSAGHSVSVCSVFSGVPSGQRWPEGGFLGGRVGGRRWCITLALTTAFWVTSSLFLLPGPPAPARGAVSFPGRPAPAQVVSELRAALAQAEQRFEAKDAAGVLAYVSDQYRTGVFTKDVLRSQLVIIFQIYEALEARVRLEEVRMVGDRVWVYTTGEVSGLLPWLGRWMMLFQWEREPEVVRQESGVWRLLGYQQ